jgi:ABC-type proline/glycine betaine transport system substrate-binding protein
MTLEKTNEALAWMKNNGDDVDKTAIWFLKENTDLWHQWVEDEEKIKRIEKALETVS